MKRGPKIDRAVADNLTRLMWLLYDDGFTLEEVGSIFKLTRERIRQRFSEIDRTCRNNRGRKRGSSIYPPWQRKLADRLIKMGVTTTTTTYLLSTPYDISSLQNTRGRGGFTGRRNKTYNRLSESTQLRYQLESAILVHAWNHGAALFDSSLVFIGSWMHRLREKGYDIKPRRSDCKVYIAPSKAQSTVTPPERSAATPQPTDP